MQEINQDVIINLQKKLSATHDMQKRSNLRHQIQQLRDEDGSGLRRSRRFKGKGNPSIFSPEKSSDTIPALPSNVSQKNFDDMECMCGCQSHQSSNIPTSNGQVKAVLPNGDETTNPKPLEVQNTKSEKPLENQYGVLGCDVTIVAQAPGSKDNTGDCDVRELQKRSSDLRIREAPELEPPLGNSKNQKAPDWKQHSPGTSAGDAVFAAALPAPAQEAPNERRTSKASAFSFFRGIRTSSSSSKDPEASGSAVKEDQTVGKRKFSKRFRRRSTKQNSFSEPSEAVADNQQDVVSNPVSTTPVSPRSESDSSEAFSPRSTSSGDSQAQKKSARVVLRALGKRIFTAKPKAVTDSDKASKNESDSSKNSNNSNNNVINSTNATPPTSARPTKTASQIMAEVLARSRDTARATSSATVYLRQKDVPSAVNDVDYEGKSVDELQNLLDACSDFETRARIRKAIRTLKKNKEDSASSSPKSFIGKGSPAVSRTTVQLSAKKQEDNSKPWEAEAKKGGFRTVSSVKFTPNSKPRETEPNSAPSRLAIDREKSLSTPISRLARGDRSSSLRTYRPTYKVSQPNFDRGASLKLSRPKDFLQSRKSPGDVRPIFHARKVSPERVVLESVASVDNTRPDSTHNSVEASPSKTAAPSPLVKRSESTKENQQLPVSPPEVPSIPVVQGNKRRSLGILGRVLSVKIDSKSSPRRVKPQQEEEQSPEKESSPNLPALEEEIAVDKPVSQTTTKTILIGTKTPEKPVINFVPVSENLEPTGSVEVTCSFSAPSPVVVETKEEEKESPPEETTSVQTEPESVEITADTEADGPCKDTTESVDLFRNEVQEILGVILDQVCDEKAKQLEPTFEFETSKKFVEPSSEIFVEETTSEKSLQEQVIREETVAEDNSPTNDNHLDTAVTVEEEKFLASDDKISENPDKEQTLLDSQESEKLSKENLNLPLDNLASSQESVSPPISDEESDKEEDMEGRLASRSRFGANGGSVKSRILAREDNNNSPGSPDVSKIRRQRQATDARALRSAEGVMSRLNKFSTESTKSENSKLNGSVRSRANQNGSVGKSRPLAQVNGSVKMTEVNNNDVTKSPTLTAKFSAPKSSERSGSPLEKLESASLSIMDEMQSLSRETPVRRSRRSRLASNETTVTTLQSKTVVKGDDGATKVEITFQSQEVTSETVVAELPLVDEKYIDAAPLEVPSESASSSHSQCSSTSFDEVQVVVVMDEAKEDANATTPETDENEEIFEETLPKESTDALTPTEIEPRESEEKVTSETRTRRRQKSDRSTSESASEAKSDTQSPSADDGAKLTGRRRRRVRKPSSEIGGSVTGDSAATSPETEVVSLPSNESKEKPDYGETPSRDATPEENVGERIASPSAEDKAREDIKVAPVDEGTETTSDDKEESVESENTSVETESVTSPAPVEEAVAVDDTTTIPEAKTKEKVATQEQEKPADKPDSMRYSIDNLAAITEEEALEKLLDEASCYEERRMIRSALRELRRKKRDGLVEKAKSNIVGRQKTTATTKSDIKDSTKPASGLQRRIGTPLGDSRVNKTTNAKSLSEKYSLNTSNSTTKKEMSSAGSKKIGSIFDRDDDDVPKKSGSRLDLERRQAERRRDLQRNRSMPATSTKDARKMFAKMDVAQSGDSKVKKVGRSPTFVVPNANNVKQMLLKWCQSKTRGYEHVDINNFSGSWANGMAFCALVHNFFPQAFDYSKLDPKNRAHNFDLAFNTAQEYADADPLLDVEDMMIMGNRPDSKCVFTYVQSLYNKLRKFEKPLKPLSPTVKVMPGIVEVDSNAPPKESVTS